MTNPDYAYVAILDGSPVAVAHSIEQIEKMLDDYTGASTGLSKRIKYVPFDSKYPSLNELEGIYFYKDEGYQEVDEYKIYAVEYKGVEVSL